MTSVGPAVSKSLIVLLMLIGSMPSARASIALEEICNNLTANQCALKVKAVLIDVSKSPEEALTAWGAWSAVYERAYRSMPNAPKTPDDVERFEDAIASKIDSFTQPQNIALDLAIARYFPRLAAILSIPEIPIVAAVMAFLAPSPIATPLQELQSTNSELSRLLVLRLTPLLQHDWRSRYGSAVRGALDGGRLVRNLNLPQNIRSMGRARSFYLLGVFLKIRFLL